jgi:hypothetical protein
VFRRPLKERQQVHLTTDNSSDALVSDVG